MVLRSAGKMEPVDLDLSALPDITEPEMDFVDSSFFSGDSSRQLPTPATLLQEYGGRQTRVIKIEHLNMVVKTNHESKLRLEELQAIWAIRQAFPNGEIPVPEIFGWRRHCGQIFIYMSLVQGETLQDAWPGLTAADKRSLQNQLRAIVGSLRRLILPTTMIASINGGKVQDRYFRPDFEEGPFLTAKAFNDWLFAAATRQNPGTDGAINGLHHPDMLRDLIPDAGSIYFCHGDLTPTNIILSGSPGLYAIAAIIDWEQAGWYPEYWEFCKMLSGVDYEHQWRTEAWAESILQPFENAFGAFAEYSMWRGGS